eukprot:10456050-Alexandrium_andersonii.AAC.1
MQSLPAIQVRRDALWRRRNLALDRRSREEGGGNTSGVKLLRTLRLVRMARAGVDGDGQPRHKRQQQH